MIDSDDTSKSVLELAEEITSNERIIQYGHPSKNFTDIARMWSVILGIEITPQQVGLCNIATKLCREINSQKRDNLVDICGYAKAVDLVNCYQEYEDEEN